MKVFHLSLCFFISNCLFSQSDFISARNQEFFLKNQPYTFIGANYWYGGLLAMDTANDGLGRLQKELNFLKQHGIINLRVLIASEGNDCYPYRISPSLQEKPLVYNESVLRSYDIFLAEASKRNMSVVFILNNNWEWSGGFGQYLTWAGYPNPILPKTLQWDWGHYCDYIAQFYTCDSCQYWYQELISQLLNRKNTITHIQYKNEPTIMAWELANEPRPMKPKAINAYKNWIKLNADFIKTIDKNHLVTIGVEGVIGTAMDANLFKEIHQFSAIDYATIHIWPKTWQWYNGESDHSIADTTLERTKSYILLHTRLCQEINKPLVIEEFGLHRDQNNFSARSATANRDYYYKYIFDLGKKEKIAGYNFWGAIAYRDSRLKTDYWKKGLPYTADPPQEEQGLYGVYMTDSSTWKIIRYMMIK
jgi:mannan endo-1,4-beta-mannosidase